MCKRMDTAQSNDMKSILPVLGLLILLMPLQVLVAQETEEVTMVRYSPDFRFKDGLYLKIDNLKNNDPIPLARIVTDLGSYNKDFINEMYSSAKIILYDDYSVRRFIYTKNIWGYAEGGRLYIMVGGQFQKISITGSISLFIASETTHVKTSFPPRDSTKYSSTTEDLYRSHNSRYYYATVTGHGGEYLFDFESNSLSVYTVEVLEKLLVRDPILFKEYAVLKKREQKKRMSEYIRRYNQNNPIYFPYNQQAPYNKP